MAQPSMKHQRNERVALELHSKTFLGRTLALFSGLIVILLAALVFTGIGLRYGFGIILAGIDEVIAAIIPLLVMVAMSQLLSNKQHIAIDILSSRLRGLPHFFARGIRSLSELVVSFVLFVSGTSMVLFAYRYDIRSPSELGTPDWLLQISMPLGGLLMLLAWVERWRMRKRTAL